jgi:hypothetical protein
MQMQYRPDQVGSFLSTMTGVEARRSDLQAEAGRVRDILTVPSYGSPDDIVAAFEAAHAELALLIDRHRDHES